jgi:hypothetical protein
MLAVVEAWDQLLMALVELEVAVVVQVYQELPILAVAVVVTMRLLEATVALAL